MTDFTPIHDAHSKDFSGEYGANVPVGEFEARLDFRVDMTIDSKRCFFTHLGTGEKFNIIAIRPGFFRKNEPDSEVNFVDDPIPVNNAFKLVMRRSCFGRAVWENAVAISEYVTKSEA